MELLLYVCAMALRRSGNKVDPDLPALVRAAWSWPTLFAYGDMKYLIIHKLNLCHMRVWRLYNVLQTKSIQIKRLS